MKLVEVLNHSDEVSGTSILDDGTKVYWTEGRSSYLTLVNPDGLLMRKVPVGLSGGVQEAIDESCDNVRLMTPDEELEHDTIMSAV